MNMGAMVSDELVTLRDFLRFAITRFSEAKIAFGHGTNNAFDEAAYLLLHALSLPIDRLEPFLDARLTTAERAKVAALLARRIDERIPAAYLTGEAWLGDFRFHVDQRVVCCPMAYCPTSKTPMRYTEHSISAPAPVVSPFCSHTPIRMPISTRLIYHAMPWTSPSKTSPTTGSAIESS